MASEAAIVRSLQLGTSRAAFKAQKKSPLVTLLELQMQEVLERLRERIRHYDINASGRLAQNMGIAGVQVKGNQVAVEMEADFYWKFINYGVNGSERSWGAPAWGSIPQSGLTFSQSIDEWLTARGITPPEQFSSRESFNYVVRQSIKKKGKEPRPFFTDVVNDALVRELQEPIEKLLGRAIEIVITEPFK